MRSNTINIDQTEQLNSLVKILHERKMQIKLMSLGVLHKYAIKDCLIMAPEKVLLKKSTLDI